MPRPYATGVIGFGGSFDHRGFAVVYWCCLGTKFGSMPCDRPVAAGGSYIPGASLIAASDSGFFFV
jgi:hypothetical protein